MKSISAKEIGVFYNLDNHPERNTRDFVVVKVCDEMADVKRHTFYAVDRNDLLSETDQLNAYPLSAEKKHGIIQVSAYAKEYQMMDCSTHRKNDLVLVQ